MHHNSQNKEYKTYSYQFSPLSRFSQNTHYQYYDPRLRTQQALYSTITSIPTYTSPYFQYQHQSSTNIFDLTEPMSIFDNLSTHLYHRSNVTSNVPTYIPLNLSQYSSSTNSRFATVIGMRERLLTDIQHNIIEIDQELYSLNQQPLISHYIPSHLSSHNENQIWQNKPKKIYEIVPRTTSESKKTLQQPTSKSNDQIPSISFIGQFHYGVEIEENAIFENDPENSDLKSTTDDIPQINLPARFSLNDFLREQSTLSQHRALISVPQYVDNNNEIETNEFIEDFHQNNQMHTDIARSSTASSSHDLILTNKLNIQDFEQFIQTAPQSNPQISSTNISNSNEISENNQLDLMNTMLSKPVKHSRLSIRTEETLSPSQQTIINPDTDNNKDNKIAYFFSDFGNEGEGDEDRISIDPEHFIFPTGSDIISDDYILRRQSQTSLLNTHSSQQPSTLQNNKEHVKEAESKRIDATTKHSVTPTSTTASKELFPISIIDSVQIQSKRNNNNSNSNSNENQRQTSARMLNMDTIEQSSENSENNIPIHPTSSSSTSDRKRTNKTPLKDMNFNDGRPMSVNKQFDSIRHRSASLRHSPKNQSSNNLSRHESFASVTDVIKIPTKQTEQVLDNEQQAFIKSSHSSTLPVPLNSPHLNNMQPSTSNAGTPERRNSSRTLNQNDLLTSSDIINLNDPSIDNHPITSSEQLNSEREGPSPLKNFVSLQQTHPNNQTDALKIESSTNQNHKKSMYQILSPTTSIHEQENNQFKSISPLTNGRKKINPDDLHLPSISPRHSDISDANLTSVDREDTYREPITLNQNNNEVEKPSTESKLVSKEQSKPFSLPPPIEKDLPSITDSQKRSELSLTVYQPKSKQEKSLNNPLPQIHTVNFSLADNNENSDKHHHVSFSNNISNFPIKENYHLKNWRERINRILTKKRFPRDKYSHIKSRVNTFENFDYELKKVMILSKKSLIPSDQQINNTENKLKKRTNQSKQKFPSIKKSKPQIFGRLCYQSDGSSKIFHEPLKWNVQSKIKSYSQENLHYKPHQSDIRIFNKTPKWHSESKLAELIKDTPRYPNLIGMIPLPKIILKNEQYSPHQESDTGIKIFDINSKSNKLIFNEKLLWKKKSKLKDSIWKNINYQPKKSKIQIFHQPIRWNKKSKIRITRSINLDIQAKVKYWSEIDLHQLTRQKALLAQTYDLKWNDVIRDTIDIPNNNYPILPLTQDIKLKDYIEENSNNDLYDQTQDETPPNQPRWNSVSKTRSVNSVYNPRISNSNLIRKGWDLELRRKRVHKLPPLKRKRDHDEIPQLAIEGPSSNDLLAIDYIYDHPLHERTASIDCPTIPSRRSSKALVPLRHLPELQLSSETPRSQRPVQQEWYDELSKSRLTHRTDMGRTTHNSFRNSIDSIHQINTPRGLLTARSSTRNSQNSAVSGVLLDSSIRTNRATELRLSRDMDEHHQHAHDPSQSMPIEIRGFQLEGTPLTVPDKATIRPLSNINYRTSEQVKNRRMYPWSTLHLHGTSSRNSSLVPIAEFRRSSFATSIAAISQSVHEE